MHEVWRLAVEAEIDSVVRELRKGAEWSEGGELAGQAALWVGGADTDTDTDSSSDGESDDAADDRRQQRQAALAGDAYLAGRMQLLQGFQRLRRQLNRGGATPNDGSTVLAPFLAVISDASTTGPVTRSALVSVERLLGQPSAGVLGDVARAVTHCRFEATDAQADEAVLMQILRVLRRVVLGGRMLSDVAVCEVMETVLSMGCQMRLSETLRRAAEAVLGELVAFVLGQAAAQEEEEEEERVEGGDAAMAMPSPSRMLVNTERQAREDTGEARGFGLAAARELYRVLVALADPHDLQHTDSMRLLALGTLHQALHQAGAAMSRVRTLRAATVDALGRHL
ncbi:GDP/GTP exchange factor for ARF, partial [Coemansia sp. RSA 2603]